ncbi:MAG: hypothetical protein D6776_02230, partial [Planctomycetota bacterium]
APGAHLEALERSRKRDGAHVTLRLEAPAPLPEPAFDALARRLAVELGAPVRLRVRTALVAERRQPAPSPTPAPRAD